MPLAGDTRLPLTPKPFAVPRHLVERAGRLVAHDEPLAAVWPDTYVQPEVLRRYILEIRRVLGDRAEKPRYVETLPSRGSRFIAPVTESPDVPAAVVPAPPATLVGRRSALAELDSCLAHALRGQRRVVFVSGETGVGKTSLVDAFRQRAEKIPSVRVVRGQSVEGFGGKEAYYPVFGAIGQPARAPAGEEVVGTPARQAPTWIVQFPSLVRPEQYATLQREILGATRERMARELCEALEDIVAPFSFACVIMIPLRQSPRNRYQCLQYPCHTD